MGEPTVVGRAVWRVAAALALGLVSACSSASDASDLSVEDRSPPSTGFDEPAVPLYLPQVLGATTVPRSTTAATRPDIGRAPPLFVTDPAAVFRTLLPAAFGGPLTGLIDDFVTPSGEHWGVTKAVPLGDRLLVMLERRADPSSAAPDDGDVIGGALWSAESGAWQLLSFRTDLARLPGVKGNPRDPGDDPRSLGDHLGAFYASASTVVVVADVDGRLETVLQVEGVDTTAGTTGATCPASGPCHSLVVARAGRGEWPELTLVVRGAATGAERRFVWGGAAYRER